MQFPNKIKILHGFEESLRDESILYCLSEQESLIHLNVIACVMDIAEVIKNHPSDNEDFKVIQMLSIRMYNAFSASLNLMLSGYHQYGALVMRDTIETSYLMDLFKIDPNEITRWRSLKRNEWKKEFQPISVRKRLESHNGNGLQVESREIMYRLASVLAAHPNNKSQIMLKPDSGENLAIGPFKEFTLLGAGIIGLSGAAVEVGEVIISFLPEEYAHSTELVKYEKLRNEWIKLFENIDAPKLWKQLSSKIYKFLDMEV